MLDAASEARIESLIAQMTLEEKVSLCAGTGMWHTAAVERLGIPPVKVTDGPNGARGDSKSGTTSACFPCGTALGATWDPELVREIGRATAQEARSKQARVLLAPTVNIHRHPLAGRNFECYSEDPYLTARTVVGYIEGVQSAGVAATVKHFVANDSEFERMTISSEVGERALREIYLPPFEAAITEAKSWAIMSAYNRINGTYAAEHSPLLRGVLKGEWEFDGLVMSDWWGTKSTVESASHGLDLEMPGRARYFGPKLLAAAEAGEVPVAVIDDKVRRLLRLSIRTGAISDPPEPPEESRDLPEHRALIRRTAASSMVLLKNEDATLPFDPAGLKLLAVIGPNGDALSVQGGGSANVEPHRRVSVLQAIRERLAGAAEVEFEPGCRIYRRTPPLSRGITAADGTDGATLEFFNNAQFAGEPAASQNTTRLQLRWLGGNTPAAITGQFSLRARATYVPEATGLHRFTLHSAGLSRLLLDGEVIVDNWTEQTPGDSFYGAGSAEVAAEVALEVGTRHNLVLEFLSPPRGAMAGVVLGCAAPEPPDLMDRAVALASRADAVVLVVGANSDWESEGADRVSMVLPGEQDELIRRVTAANPRTAIVVNVGSPTDMRGWIDGASAVLQAWYPGQEGGYAISDVVFGDAEPGGRLPTTFPLRVEDAPSHLTYPGEADTVSYGEGVFVGYRGYEKRAISPLFPFGHGLSYSTFEISDLALDRSEFAAGGSVTARVTVTNSGSRAGSTVVQVYVSDIESTLLRPARELKGFEKVRLEAGEQHEVAIELGPRAFSAWDPRSHSWLAEPGEFRIEAGFSAGDIRSSAIATLLA